MDKKLISEITRIGEIMGVKGSSLINESIACPFCDAIMKQVSNLSALASKNSESIEFKYKVNELLERVKNSEDLNINQKAALQNVINKLKEVESVSDDVSSFKLKVQDAINKNEALKSVMKTKSDLINYKVMSVIDYSKIYNDPKLINDYFENVPKMKEIVVMIDNTFSSPSFKTFLSKEFKSVDEYADDVGKTLGKVFKDNFIDETLSNGLANKFKNYVKEKFELEPDLNPFISKIDDVAEPKPKVEEPKVNTGDGDTIESATAEDTRNLFERSAGEVNIEDLNVIQKLRVFVNNNSSLDDSNMTVIKKVLDSINNGKKVSLDEVTIRNAFESKKFSKSEIDVYIKKLNNPTKGNGYVHWFYWRVVEPLFKRWVSLELPSLIKRMLGGKPKTTQELVNDFQKGIDKVLSNFDENQSYAAEIRELRIKFGKIRQADSTVNKYYSVLYKDWFEYMEKNLTGEMLESFKKFNNKLLEQKENFLSSSWSNLIGREVEKTLGANGEEIIKFKFNSSKPVTDSVKQALTIAKNNVLKSNTTKKYLLKGLNYLLTNVFRTAKEQEEFLIKRGYKRNGKIIYDAGLQNYLFSTVIKYVIGPFVLGGIVGIIEETASILFGTEYSQLDIPGWMNAFWGNTDWLSLINPEFKERAPWFYQLLVDSGALKLFSSPAITAAITLMAKSVTKLPTKEERATQAQEAAIDAGITYANNESTKKWESSDESARLNIQNQSGYLPIKSLLERGSFPGLTKEEQTFLLSRLSFEPTASIASLNNIKTLNKDEISNSINDKTVGNTVLKGKSGKLYVIVNADSAGTDPFKVLEKTNDANIKKQGVAVVKPPYGELRPGTNKTFISVNQFVEEYNDL
jgi:hypothetical protein